MAGPTVRPSLFTAIPLITAMIRSPLEAASDSRRTTTTPAPSAGTNPPARRSKAWNSGVGVSSPRCANTWCAAGPSMSVTPPTTAASISPARRACAARFSATSADEQAVSTTTLGPRRSKYRDTVAAR
ncbi:hypothetical protein SAXI111661_20065 [Saccharomonospora xinjiangensis]